MIDLHSHVLPGVDDGSRSYDESLRMIQRWANAGFERVVSTPHLNGPLPDDYRARIAEARSEIEDDFEEAGVEFTTGFEIMLDPGVAQRLSEGAPLRLGGSNVVLVEVPFLLWPPFTESALFDIQLAGFRPILAHPERYEAVQHDLSLAVELGRRGIVLQLTFASLSGALGHAPKRTAERLIELDLPFILASDAHNDGTRLQAVPDGLARAEELVGADRVQEMTVDRPLALIDDLDLPEPTTNAAPQRQGVLSRIRR